jgi:plastocyanin
MVIVMRNALLASVVCLVSLTVGTGIMGEQQATAPANQNSTASYMISVGNVGGVHKVVPATLTVKPGDKVTIRNDTGGVIGIFFPEQELFQELPKPHHVIDVPAGGSTPPHTVKGKAGMPPKSQEIRHYAVFCDVAGVFAIGNSNPIIIIDHS